ncbi:hypothetical protein BDZ88DRAFT_406897 [Geranomyces variabilis]|nr:hypothetical protein BDZ88DRAFT_406897 [Geranomyces variabilis]KAJ3139290.1 hypothetical protein HDU90_000656 [Geranomyces variabilis]
MTVTVQASTVVLPIIDLAPFFKDPSSPEALAECKKAADALEKYSALAVRDPRVSEGQSATFLDTMEDYFVQPTEAKLPDARPEFGYQVGVTPANTEKPRCGRDESCNAMVAEMEPQNRPLPYDGVDPKWRFFWRIGEAPKETQFARLNADPVVPAAFPQWESVMNTWGTLMHDAVSGLAEMLAVGYGLPRDTFVKMAQYGPHLLAPTGSDLEKYGKVGTVLAGFHTDLNFLTIHGKSRFPGLHIWTRSGTKMLAKVPDGCLLVQAGKQIEICTGGAVVAGFHEVVVVEDTLKAIERQQARQRPLWRISSTLFFHMASDTLLQPLGSFATPEALAAYPPILAGKQVQRELGFISLMDENTV